MREVTAENAAAYLIETGRVERDVPIAVRELSGGVSNIVLRVAVAGQPPFVIKQCRERLRVPMEWFSRLDRIWMERTALEVLTDVLPAGMVPRVWFDDRANYLFAMDCAPDRAVTWKSLLMTSADGAGPIAVEVGRALRTLHEEARGHPALEGQLADTTFFDELRVDPYYRTVARAHPDLAPRIEDLIASLFQSPAPTLVLGDYSPKNILVQDGQLTLLDFECAHAGDPAFDIGFCLSHLLLKLARARGNEAYREVVDRFLEGYFAGSSIGGSKADTTLTQRGARHAAACMLARLDGKSPVEYRAELDQDAVRRFARNVLTSEHAIPCEALVELLAAELR